MTEMMMKKSWRATSDSVRDRESSSASPNRARSRPAPTKDRISNPIPLANSTELALQDMDPRDLGGIDEDAPKSNATHANSKPQSPFDGELPEDHRRTDTTPQSGLQRRSPDIRVAQDARHAQEGNGRFTSDAELEPVQELHHAEPQNGNAKHPNRKPRTSYFSAESTSDGKDQSPRKKSALRDALGRLFSRKKKTASQASTLTPGSAGHTPELSNANQNNHNGLSKASQRSFEHKRSVSMPLSEHDKAQRSQSIGMKGTATAESARNSCRVESNFSRRRPGTQALRRSLTPGELSGLSPRPASTHGRISKTGPQSDDPDRIGQALTSDAMKFKRRSRSLTALNLTENDHGGGRRRSGEIRYWRASHDPEYKSPISSTHADPEDQILDDEQDDMPDQGFIDPPLEPFSFSDAGLAGMKITAAATLDSRISKLETRTDSMDDHLKAVKRYLEDIHADQVSLSTLEPLDKFLGVAPPPRETLAENFAIAKGNRTGPVKGRDLAAATDSAKKARPASTSTIRGNNKPSQSKDATMLLTNDHYATLIALLDTERSARLALESRVKTLDYQMSILRKGLGQQPSINPLGNSKPSFGSAFDDDDSEDNEPTARLKRNVSYDDDDEYSASYATPHEIDTTDDEYLGYKNGRTLSLSQITMKSSRSKIQVAHDPLPGR